MDASSAPAEAAPPSLYRCSSRAAATEHLDFDPANAVVVHRFREGAVVEALEHGRTQAGTERVRTLHGWVSLVASRGTTLLAPVGADEEAAARGEMEKQKAADAAPARSDAMEQVGSSLTSLWGTMRSKAKEAATLASEKARRVDEQYNVKQRIDAMATQAKTKAGQLDERYQISKKASTATQAVKEPIQRLEIRSRVMNAASSLGAARATAHVPAVNPEMVATAQAARTAALSMAPSSLDLRNDALRCVAEVLRERQELILEANRLDKAAAEERVADGTLSSSLFKRLNLDAAKFEGLLSGLEQLMALPDPIGQVTYANRLDEGLELYRETCPLGVICVIFEARPEAAVQIASLAIKSANAIILKGGREAAHSNAALVDAIREALSRAKVTSEGDTADGTATEETLPVDAVQLVSSREEVHGLLQMDKYIDLVIPRGSNALVRNIQESTRIPVLGHADGICAVYVDVEASLEKAVKVVVDSKTQYPAACNAAETLLVHRAALPRVLVPLCEALLAAGVTLVGDEEVVRNLPAAAEGAEPMCAAAAEQDFHTEFSDMIIAIKVVRDVEEAVEHINDHGSHHTDCIVSDNKTTSKYFQANVDSAGVYCNASTRFADGFRYGFGAEVGISTNKTHARGPVGMEGLTIYKYKLHGDGHVVADYSGAGATQTLKHESIAIAI